MHVVEINLLRVFRQHFGHAFIIESLMIEGKNPQSNKLAGLHEKVSQDGNKDTLEFIRSKVIIHQALGAPILFGQEG